jgi:hypothetical protein
MEDASHRFLCSGRLVPIVSVLSVLEPRGHATNAAGRRLGVTPRMSEAFRPQFPFLVPLYLRATVGTRGDSLGGCMLRRRWSCRSIIDAGCVVRWEEAPCQVHCLHFQLHKSGRIIFERDQLHRQILLPDRQQFVREHCETAIAGFRSANCQRFTSACTRPI